MQIETMNEQLINIKKTMVSHQYISNYRNQPKTYSHFVKNIYKIPED
jgi:hypothetical protein